MQTTSQRLLSALWIAAMAGTAFAQNSQGNSPQLSGSWKGTVTPASPPGLQPFTSLMTFTDCSVIESRRLFVPASPLGPIIETTGHGAWVAIDETDFDIHFIFLLEGAVSGADLGTDNVHLRVSLDTTGTHLSGTFESTIKDPSRKSDLPRERYIRGNADLAASEFKRGERFKRQIPFSGTQLISSTERMN